MSKNISPKKNSRTGQQATVERFVEQCKQSSSAAYERFKKLLIELEQPETRVDAFQFLWQLKSHCEKNQLKACHFQFLKQNILDDEDQPVSLDLLQFPSTFLPEEWSFTFYEGLIRYPANEYHNKKVTELGCGIGWISLALALRYPMDSIIGLDINPKAITCARLNLYLNALNPDGSCKVLFNGKSLLDLVSFHESNLFSHFNDNTSLFDRIIGCIPQVLNPEPEVMENLIAENATDEYLHSLSNYFAKQGYIEDQFGLGLIASAVEQSISILRSNGKLIFNLGGRPGRSVLERLMQRRGFEVRRVWQTQVEQAADTEIDTLVDIEKNTGHRFEFYMATNSDTPIDAQTALEYAKAGGKIYHSVDVYEAQMPFPDQVKSIYGSVDHISGQGNKLAGQGLRSAVDLTYDSFADAEERYSFLAFLAKTLMHTSHFPYQDTAGLPYFRQQLAEFFRYYLHVDICDREIVITPDRRDLVASLLTSYRPRLTLVAKSLYHLVEKNFNKEQSQVLQTPSRVELLMELIDKLKPQIVITQMDRHEVQSSQLVEQLVQCAIQNNALLVIDLTDNIDLSSQPDIHGVYRYLADNALPSNLVLMAGLVNNRVYQDYSLNITLTSNPTITKHLVDSAEFTYSRTPVLKQLYYAHLLEELLFFQRTRSISLAEKHRQKREVSIDISLCEQAKAAFSHPATKGNHLAFDNETVRLDFGENELDSPAVLKEVLLESYLVRKCTPDETSTEEPLQILLSQRFNLPQGIYSKMIFGNGVAPLYSALLNLVGREDKTLVIPSGSYGYFRAAAEYKSIDVNVLQTNEGNNFKITAEELQSCVSKRKGCWLFLNAPVVNPTGAIYTRDEMKQLLAIAAKNEVSVIMDCIFTGLEYVENLRWDLADNINDFASAETARLIIIGGVSKEYAAAGLRFGYGWSTSKQLTSIIASELPYTPHFTLGYAVRKLLETQLSNDLSMVTHLRRQRKTLAVRAKILSDLLEEKGWKVIRPEGGLFLVAKPQRFIDENNLAAVEGGDLIAKRLFEKKNVVINNSTWTGLPGYCRFVLSCSEAGFNEATDRIRDF